MMIKKIGKNIITQKRIIKKLKDFKLCPFFTQTLPHTWAMPPRAPKEARTSIPTKNPKHRSSHVG